MVVNSAYQRSKEAGYSDPEILEFLSTHPKYSEKVNRSRQSGHSDQDILSFLSGNKKEEKPQRSNLESGLRTAAQYGLGALQASPGGIAYELASVPVGTEGLAFQENMQGLTDEFEDLETQRQFGNWSPKDQERYDYVKDKIMNPHKTLEDIENAPRPDISIQGLAQKATGIDFTPENLTEKAARWMGFVKDPKKLAQLAKGGLSKKDLVKAIAPSGGEALRGLTAGTALTMAENEEFGPIGTMAAAFFGDVAGAGLTGALKGAKNLITNPKETIAKAITKFTPQQKKDIQKQLINDFKQSGIQPDLGTITDNNVIKWMQARVAQSGLVGKAQDEFRQKLTQQVVDEYKAIADGLAQATYVNAHEAGQFVTQAVKDIRDQELGFIRGLYKKADERLTSSSKVDPKSIAQTISRIKSSLKPGSVKSTEQSAVLGILEKLENDIYETIQHPAGAPLYDASGNLISKPARTSRQMKNASVKDLMNNKIALNDIINYEIQGGQKQLLKQLISDLDRAIISYGKKDMEFAKNYIQANKSFSKHAKTFRNNQIANLLKSQDPSQLYNKMNSTQGIRNLGDILNKTPEGKKVFDGLKRRKLDDVITKNMVDSTSQQVKLGTFSKLLEKGKNREIIKEILGPKEFRRLEKLQKNAGALADSAQKFYNASKSGVVAADAGVVAKGLYDFGMLLSGNPWPIFRLGGGVMIARKLSNLMVDPQFLKYVEEAMKAAKSNNPQMISLSVSHLKPYFAFYQNMINEKS